MMDVGRIGSLLSSLQTQQIAPQAGLEKPQSHGATEGGASGSAFSKALESLGKVQEDTDRAIELLIKGEPVDLHQVMISAEKTDIAFRLAIQLRNKLVRAYEEVMRMQV